MKFHDNTSSYDYPFPTVALAYFLRYPNPYSTHVLSTDVIDRHFDPQTQTLYTARLHLKRSKVPSAVLRLLPRSWLGIPPPPTGAADDAGGSASSSTSQSLILERSAVDVARGVMVTESRNLEFTGILAVVERQLFRRPGVDLGELAREGSRRMREGWRLPVPVTAAELKRRGGAAPPDAGAGGTDVTTRVELYSRLGEGGRRLLGRRSASASARADADASTSAPAPADEAAPPAKVGFLRAWGRASIQRSIEAIGLRRTERAVPNSHKGMNVVLSRLRQGGLVKALEEMRHDSELVYGRVGDGAALRGAYAAAAAEEED